MGKLLIVEYLRGIAALSVAWFHLTGTYANGPIKTSGSLGWLGVDVFFVISGFIIPASITRIYGDNYTLKNFRSFITRRFIRVEIPYVASMLLALLLWYLATLKPGFTGQHPNCGIGCLTAHLFYIVPWTKYQWLQEVYWTLGYEFIFYVAIGLGHQLVAGERDWRNWYIIVILGLSLNWNGYLPDRALLFLIGLTGYRIHRYASIDLALGGLSLLFIGFTIAKHSQGIAIVGLLTMAFIIIFSKPKFSAKLPRGMLPIAACSYSLYLTHVLIGARIVNIGRKYATDPLSELLLSSVALVISVAFAYLFMLTIEKPAIQLSRKISNRSKISGLPAHIIRSCH